MLVLARTLIAIASLDDNLRSTRKQALSACTSVENVGSAMASMPHYMSQGVNELTASGVEKAVNGLMSMVSLSITAVEEIVVFVVNLLTSTYVCLITLAVSGSLHVALDVAEKVTGFLNSTLGDIGKDVHTEVEKFAAGWNKFASALNSIPTAFGGKPGDVPSLGNVNKSLAALDHLQLPAGLNEGLNKLNQSIPTFAEVNNMTNSLIRLPFEEIKKLINESMTAFEFNRSTFPVPAREQLTFCSDNNGINDFFDDLVHVEQLARKIFIAVLIVLAILACIPMAYREIRRWRTMQQRAQLVTKNAYDPMDVVYISSRPYTSSAGIWLANRFSSVRHQTLVRWTVAYATSVPALFVLSLGVAGLFACLCQYILLKAVEKEVPALTNQVADFAGKVVTSLSNASEQWAVGTNAAIVTTNANINHELFGWVNTSTTAVNHTLNEIVDGMTDVLNKTFGGTILYDPITEVLNCLIGLKIQGIEKALTWVHDHAHIDFPLLPNDTFSLGTVAKISNNSSAQSFLASPQSSAQDEISDAVVSLTKKIEDGIRKEALISTVVLLIWVIIVLIGFSRSTAMFFGHSKSRAEGGQEYAIDPATDSVRVHGNHRPHSSAPPYEYANADVNSHAPYTLNPHPFPTFEASPSNRRDVSAEKIGHVGVQNVGNTLRRPALVRQSTHGAFGSTTPTEKSGGDPFADYAR